MEQRRVEWTESLKQQLDEAVPEAGAARRARWLLEERLVEYVTRWRGFERQLGRVSFGDLFGVIEVGASAIDEEFRVARPPTTLELAWKHFRLALEDVRNERVENGEQVERALSGVVDQARLTEW
jgi:hypothetical protein